MSNRSNKIKSLLLLHYHSTCYLLNEILESVLQTVQKQFTYRQYILTDLYRWQYAIKHTYTQYTQCTNRHTYSYQYCTGESSSALHLCERTMKIVSGVNAEELKAVYPLHRCLVDGDGCVLCSVSWNPPPAPWSCRCWVRGGSTDTI